MPRILDGLPEATRRSVGVPRVPRAGATWLHMIVVALVAALGPACADETAGPAIQWTTDGRVVRISAVDSDGHVAWRLAVTPQSDVKRVAWFEGDASEPRLTLEYWYGSPEPTETGLVVPVSGIARTAESVLPFARLARETVIGNDLAVAAHPNGYLQVHQRSGGSLTVLSNEPAWNAVGGSVERDPVDGSPGPAGGATPTFRVSVDARSRPRVAWPTAPAPDSNATPTPTIAEPAPRPADAVSSLPAPPPWKTVLT